MQEFLASVGGWKTRLGGISLICAGSAGVLTGLSCMVEALMRHDFSGMNTCWDTVIVGVGSCGAGWAALGVGHKIERGVEALEAQNNALRVASAPPPPTERRPPPGA